MKLIKKLFLWLLGIAASIVLLVVGLQTYYHFTPATLSAEALALNQRAAKIPTITENGYRLNGLLAPAGLDPTQYGRCLAQASELHTAEVQASNKPIPAVDNKAAYDDYWKSHTQRSDLLHANCLQGGVLMQMPTALTGSSAIKPGITDEQWRVYQNATPDPIIVARAESVWSTDEPRRLGGRAESPLPTYGPLLQLERWRIAKAVAMWQTGSRAAANSAWQQIINDWVKSADDTLIDAMLSTNALSQTLIAVQQSAARSDRINDTVAASMMVMLKPIELMPVAVTQSLLAEWQSSSTLITDLPAQAAKQGTVVGVQFFEVNDTLNNFAQSQLFVTEAVSTSAHAQTAKSRWYEGMTSDCEWLGDYDYLCLPFLRNSTGRILASIGTPNYADYGTRVADLRNFAAVTRLTIEARRRGLTGDALTQFIANAPAEMRDVFSGNAFSYDVAAKRLRVELRAKSNVLGDVGPYEVAL
jgi:hypothetical protein